MYYTELKIHPLDAVSNTIEEFRLPSLNSRSRKQHSAVESVINVLEVHGLDRCPDRGIDGFKRYVSLAIVARNIQKQGATLLKEEKQRDKV